MSEHKEVRSLFDEFSDSQHVFLADMRSKMKRNYNNIEVDQLDKLDTFDVRKVSHTQVTVSQIELIMDADTEGPDTTSLI
ncbi:hypothetical protein ACTXT7_004124 [Hymenolepis weldensis]